MLKFVIELFVRVYDRLSDRCSKYWPVLRLPVLVLCILAAVSAGLYSIRYARNEQFIQEYESGSYDTAGEESLMKRGTFDSYVPYYNVANARYQEGRFEEAAGLYRQALEKGCPADRECAVRINLAMSLCQQIDFDALDTAQQIREAISQLEAARSVLIEGGFAAEEDDSGTSQEAEELKRDIENKIRELEELLDEKEDETESLSEEETEDVSEKATEGGSEEASEGETESASEEASEEVSEETSETASEETSEKMSEKASEEATEDERTSEEQTEDASENETESASEEASEDTSEELTEAASEPSSEEPPEDLTEDASETAPEETENMTEEASEQNDDDFFDLEQSSDQETERRSEPGSEALSEESNHTDELSGETASEESMTEENLSGKSEAEAVTGESITEENLSGEFETEPISEGTGRENQDDSGGDDDSLKAGTRSGSRMTQGDRKAMERIQELMKDAAESQEEGRQEADQYQLRLEEGVSPYATYDDDYYRSDKYW